jgi:carboxypeptidase Taq
MKTLDALLTHYRELALLESVDALLGWDTETQAPVGSMDLREEQMGALAKSLYRLRTHPEFREGVLALNSKALPDSHAQAQAAKLQKDLHKDLALNETFVSRQAERRVRLQNQWKLARQEKNFSKVSADLQQYLELVREQNARYRDSVGLKTWVEGRSDYELCLDEYEPGFDAATLRRLLGELVQATQSRLPKILDRQRTGQNQKMSLDSKAQEKLCLNVARQMGFDFSRGRLDVSTHPFCGGHPLDTRITVRYNTDDFTEALLSLVHEVGHALYEQGLPKDALHTPCGKAASFGIHESQSRLWENFVGRSLPFCQWLGGQTQMSPQDLFGHLNHVSKSWIRTESDEVTYNLHIALRMGIEEDLVEGRLKAKDLRDRWNADFKALFGLDVPSDDLGCLQDIHWFGGAFGYFPTYSLGNLVAAQLMERFLGEVGEATWNSSVEKGDWSRLLQSLRSWVHSQAAFKKSPDTIREALGGQELSSAAFVRYLDRKYLS